MISAKAQEFKWTGAHQHSLGKGNLLMLFLSMRLLWICAHQKEYFFQKKSMRLTCSILKVVKSKHPYKVR